MKRYLLALFLVAASAFSQEPPNPNVITITGPAAPIQVGPVVELNFTGLTDEELRGTKLTVTPDKGAVVKQSWDWVRGPRIDFDPYLPGKYTVTLTLNAANEWRPERVARLLSVRDSRMDKSLLDELDKFVADFTVKLAEAHPFKTGSTVVEVAGSVPFFPPDPNLPNPPNPLDPNLPQPPSKVTMVTYVYEKDNNNVPRLVQSALQQINAEHSGSVVASTFEEDNKDGNGEIPEQYKVALEAAQKAGLPALVVQSGSTVVKVVKDPRTKESVLEVVK